MTKSETASFEVYSFTKVPYVTKFLEILLILLIVFLVITSIPLMYLNNSSSEIRLLFFIAVYPETLRYMMSYSTIFILLIFPFYLNLKRKRNAILILNGDTIEVKGKNYIKTFPIETIRVLYCFDPQTEGGFPKEKFTIAIYSNEGKPTRVQLLDYSQVEKIMNLLMNYENLKMEVFSDKYYSVVDEE